MDFISHRRSEYLTALQQGTMAASVLLFIFLLNLQRSASFSIPALVLLGASFASYRILGSAQDYRLASRVYVTGLLLGMMALMVVAQEHMPVMRNIAPFGLTLIASIAGLLLPSREAQIDVAAGVLWIVIFAIVREGNLYDLMAVFMAIASTAVATFSAGNLYQMADWALQSYRRSQQRADELWESQESLRKALAKQDWLNEQLRVTNLSLEQAREAAEEANRLKTQFVANMSHELRTPLNSIINFTRIVMEGYAGPVTDEQVTYLGYVRYAGEHLLGLINDILDLAKIEAGKLEVHVEPLDLHPLLEGVMSTAVGLTRDKSVALYKEIPETLPKVMADERRVRQILLNLLSNAAKFTEEGHITLRVEIQEAFVCLSVQDTGIGIAQKDFDKVFEEFRQVDERVARRVGGTGLGMPISKKLVEMQGGSMWFESQVGVGSTFHFTLPVANLETMQNVSPEGGNTS